MLFPTGTVNETGVSKHQNLVLICYIGFGFFFSFSFCWSFDSRDTHVILFALQQIKSAERYLKKLEFHLAKVNPMSWCAMCIFLIIHYDLVLMEC